MSAPAGWHLQPDGRERFWDGTQWTDQFRAVSAAPPSDPTAPPPPPSWARSDADEQGATSGGADPTADPAADATADSAAAPTDPAATAQQPAWDQTQALDVSSTQALPAPQGYADAQQAAPTGSDPYASQPPTYAAPSPGGLPSSGYGAPGAPGQPGPGWQPPQRSGNAWLKGCLIALVVVVVLAIGAIVAAVFIFGRAVESVSDSVSSSFPSDLPSGLPTELPSDLPTEGLGEQIGVRVGRGFEIPRATIEDGWSLNKQGAGALSVVTVDGMRATLQDDDGFPVLFTISFPPAGGGEAVQTVCTAPAGAAGATVDVSCVPLLGDVADARQGTVTTTL